MTSHKAKRRTAPRALEALAADARRDFERMLFPAPNWVPPVAGPDGRPALDVLVIGGGMCGQTAAFALAPRRRAQRARHRSRGPRPRGPLGHLRAHGHAALAQAPDRPRPRLSRADVPRLVRGPARGRRLAAPLQDRHLRLAGLPAVGARHRADRRSRTASRRRCIDLDRGFVRVQLAGPGGAETVVRAQSRAGRRTRRRRCALRAAVPLAGARPAGRARPRLPLLPTDIDFARFRGGRVGVLGASASAFDNAAVALEAGARAGAPVLAPPASAAGQQVEVDGLSRASSTAIADLDDARRWRIYTYIFGEGVPPPHESVLRCDRHAGFAIHFAEPWIDVVPDGRRRRRW